MGTLPKVLLVAAIISVFVANRQAGEADRLQGENRRLRESVGQQVPPASPLPEPLPRTGAASPEDRARRIRQAADEAIRKQLEMADQGVYEHSRSHRLMEKGGKGLSAGAAQDAGLTDQEHAEVSRLLSDLWHRSAGDFARRAERVEEESDEQGGRMIYRVIARPDRGKEFKDELIAGLADAVGLVKREILMSNYQSGDFFEGFGAGEVRLEFTAGETKFRYFHVNPVDGEETGSGADSLEEFSDRFGDSFEIPFAAGKDPEEKD